MSIVMPATEHRIAAVLEQRRFQAADVLRTRFDDALVRFDGWWLVFVAALLALGFVLVAGAAIWCATRLNGRTFTGGMSWKNGFQVSIECR